MVAPLGKDIEEMMINGFDDLDWETPGFLVRRWQDSRAPGLHSGGAILAPLLDARLRRREQQARRSGPEPRYRCSLRVDVVDRGTSCAREVGCSLRSTCDLNLPPNRRVGPRWSDSLAGPAE